MLKRAFVAVTLTLATTSVTAPISGPADAAGTRESRIFYSACPGEVVEGACINSNGRRIPTELLSMRADGTGRDRVTRNRVHEQDPIWGPSGGRVVFEASDTLFNCNYDSYLATVPVWGSGAQQPVTRRGNYRCDEPADWSPDGNRLLFTRESTLCRDIWTVRRDGSMERFTNNCDADPSSDEYASDPNWAGRGAHRFLDRGGHLDHDPRGRQPARDRPRGGRRGIWTYPRWSPRSLHVDRPSGSQPLHLEPRRRRPGADRPPEGPELQGHRLVAGRLAYPVQRDQKQRRRSSTSSGATGATSGSSPPRS